MKKNLDNYEEIITDDGSITVFSKLYREACHSTSGARAETKLHYIEGCDILTKSQKPIPLHIFEAGFGLGIGFEETFKALSHKKFIFITTEIDEDLVKYVIEENVIYQGIERFESPVVHYKLHTDRFYLLILIGDARETVPKLSKLGEFEFDCIYQDAFSPKRNAILWTKEWFELLKSYSNKSCIMSTYSSSSSIRKSMIAAGWKVYHGEKFGTKRSSTRARLSGETQSDILEHLERSPAITITDENYKEYTLGS